MYLLDFCLLVFWLLIVPLLSGTFVINRILRTEKYDLVLAFVSGYFLMLATFYIICMPMLFLKMPLSYLVFAWGLLMICFCALGLYMSKQQYKSIWNHIQQVRTFPWYTVIVVLLILMQAFLLFRYVHDDIDDSFYVASATTSVHTNTIMTIDPLTGSEYLYYPYRYVLSPFPIFVATISKLVMIHPAILAHTILPVFFIPLSYLVYAAIGKKLFPKDSDTPYVVLFLFFLCVINIFGNISIYTSSTFLLFRIWQGKAFLANIILPGIFYFSLRSMPKESHLPEWLMLFCTVLAACLVSAISVVLVPVMIGCLGLLFTIRNKKFRTLLFSIVVCIPLIICGVIYVIGQ